MSQSQIEELKLVLYMLDDASPELVKYAEEVTTDCGVHFASVEAIFLVAKIKAKLHILDGTFEELECKDQLDCVANGLVRKWLERDRDECLYIGNWRPGVAERLSGWSLYTSTCACEFSHKGITTALEEVAWANAEAAIRLDQQEVELHSHVWAESMTAG